MNLRVFDLSCDLAACKPIVDAPADITGTGVCPVCPPTICVGFVGVGGAECVSEAGGKKRAEAVPLLVGKTMFADVWLWICQVNFLVGNIEITAEKYWFSLLKLLHVCDERWIPVFFTEL